MSKEISFAAARLERDVPAAEGRVDDALIAVSSLMTSVVTARRDTIGVPATSGHATIRRLAKAQMALVDVSGDILRVMAISCKSDARRRAMTFMNARRSPVRFPSLFRRPPDPD